MGVHASRVIRILRPTIASTLALSGATFWRNLEHRFYLPQQPVAQPVPVIVGSTAGAGAGTLLALVSHGPLEAALIASFLLWLLPRLGIYHPPAIALSMYPLLLKPGPWFPLIVVLPFIIVAVGSNWLLSHWIPHWPQYPLKHNHCCENSTP